MNRPVLLPFVVLCAAAPAAAAEAPPNAEPWSFGAAASFYVVEDEPDFVQPTATADRGRLHFEGRVNYEARDTGSAWIGWNLAAGDEVALAFTPMIGAVFGDTTGVAPGFHFSLGWRALELYSESEYVIDADGEDGNYFYTWTELTVAPSERWRAGLVVQRTRAYETELDVQRGLLVGYSTANFDFTLDVFNPDRSATVVFAVGASF